MNNQSIIKVKNLWKTYKQVEVLKGIDLSIERGSIFALLGSNGAGKTTTVKILSTLLKANQGEVILAGCDVIKHPKSVKKHIALTGQYTALDEILTGRENLMMIGKLLNVNNCNEMVASLLKKFDMEKAADRRVSTYSGGMKRKIDIAMSLIGSPSVIFLDEPTTGLDPQSRKSMWETIRQLSDTGVTIFLTTQYLDEAEALADKVAILDKGVIIVEGTNDEIKAMISSNIVSISLENIEDAHKAQMILNEYHSVIDENDITLKVDIHESMEDIFKILSKLRKSNIEVIDFEKKKASLEDVFLQIVSGDQERNVEDAINY